MEQQSNIKYGFEVPQSYPELSLASAINAFVYGIKLDIRVNNEVHHQVTVFISHTDNRILKLINNEQVKIFQINLTKIVYIEKTEDKFLKIKLISNQIFFILDHRDEIQYGLNKLIENAKQSQAESNICISELVIQFSKFGKDTDQPIELNEIWDILKKIQIHLTPKQTDLIKLHYGNQKYMTVENILNHINQITQTDEIIQIFSWYAVNKQQKLQITKDRLKLFLEKEQNTYLNDQQLDSLIQKYSHIEGGDISSQQFQQMLFNNSNHIFKPENLHQYQPEDYPLTDYYMSSSHNTYLAANQLTGESSLQAYIDAFLLGFKCVEIDCWDGPHGDPIVTHGHTLTSQLRFQDVIQTIDEYAFYRSPYPVVLSLEVHCGYKQQGRMAELLQQILGKKLFTINPNDLKRKLYPSLAELKYKIILKNKGKCQKIQNQSTIIHHDIDQIKKNFYKYSKSYDATVKNNSESDDDDIPHEKFEKENENLNAITALFGTKLDLDHPTPFIWCISSISEEKLTSLINHNEQKLTQYLGKYFARIYPKGSRIDSTNYNPIPAWNIGAQIVALNVQTKDLPMLLNQGKFQENGFTGYVLKRKHEAKMNLKIKIISAHHISWKDNMNPIIKIRLSGSKIDEGRAKKWKTSVVENNGFNPTFSNYEVQMEINNPELAIIYFIIETKKHLKTNELIAQYALSPLCMRQGYRIIPMWNKYMQKMEDCFIFAHIQYTFS